MMLDAPLPRRGRGRPLKFGTPATSITLTLPDEAISRLRAIDRDIGRAIVRLLRVADAKAPPSPLVGLHKTGHRSVIVVTPVDALRQLDGLELVSLGDPRRALLMFGEGMTPAQFELRIQDLLDGRDVPSADREVIRQISEVLRDARRSTRYRVSSARIIVLDETDPPSRRR